MKQVEACDIKEGDLVYIEGETIPFKVVSVNVDNSLPWFEVTIKFKHYKENFLREYLYGEGDMLDVKES